ncbi:DUF3040 domain-containing protein [Streptomyces sp. NPDC093085]|uniref:DUF3040 domain-containing protein n=1 Tax=Streptomyces sp. NPDC093085 TaxID=3155068 RepID=UPI003427B9D4
MATDEDRLLGDLAERLRHDDPRFFHALEAGTPYPPREYRHGTAWLTLAVALGGLALGIVIGHGLLIAGGLVLAGIAGHLFDPDRARARTGRGTPPPSW